MTSYYSRTSMLPKKLVTILNNALNHFQWSGNCFSKNSIPCALKKINIPKHKGGLGILNLRKRNIVAASKHLNALLSGQQTLWVVWMTTHYLQQKNFWTMVIPNAVSWLFRSLLNLRPVLFPFIRYNATSTTIPSFCHTRWATRGLVIHDVLTYNQEMTTGIPDNALARNYIHNNIITLLYSSCTDVN